MALNHADILALLLTGLRLVLFALSLGLTLVSFQAYRRRQSKRLETAFIGFAFISMGVGLTALTSSEPEMTVHFQIAETIPFIIGFSMLYLSLYR